MPLEDATRDHLARNLFLLEDGLELLEIEHRLNNPIGAKGFVDILARDSLGNRVIVEVKRSDIAARHALHELYKYVALFKIVHGLRSHQLRLFLVATDWHELRVPFAEFCRTSDYQIQGFVIEIDEEGRITTVAPERVVDLPAPAGLFERHHHILLFGGERERDEAVDYVKRALQTRGAGGYLLIIMDYSGMNPAVMCRFALYVVPAQVDPERIADLRVAVAKELELSALGEVTSDQIEEEFGCEMLAELAEVTFDYEIGYPEKFVSIQHQGWTTQHILRAGALASSAAATDEELIRRVAGEEGTSVVHYRRISSPRLHLHWKDFVFNATRSLDGNETWTCGFAAFCRVVEESYRHASAAAVIYNPMNLPVTLYKLFARSDADYVPYLECTAVGAGDAEALIFWAIWRGTERQQ